MKAALGRLFCFWYKEAMATITLATLIKRARDRADMPVDGFVTDEELTDWVNEGLQQLHKLLVDAFETEYAFKEQAMSYVSGTTDYALPADFFRLFGVDFDFAGTTRALKPYNQAERNAYKNRSGPGALWFGVVGGLPRYSLIKNQSSTGSMLRLLPANVTTSGRLLYAPTVTTLVDGADSVELPDGWEKYVIVFAAIQMLTKEESSTTELQKQLARWDEDLIELKATRDAANPKQTVDVDRMQLDGLDFF